LAECSSPEGNTLAIFLINGAEDWSPPSLRALRLRVLVPTKVNEAAEHSSIAKRSRMLFLLVVAFIFFVDIQALGIHS
jgi:hypothetical protein